MSSLTPQLTGALAMFAFATSITPGPNNTMLLSSGTRFGFRASAPHMAGVAIGFIGLVVAVGLGLGGVFAAYPALHTALKWIGGAYLVYLAVRIGMSGGPSEKTAGDRPMTFLEAAAFQVVNPKGWSMALGMVATYVPAEGYLVNLLVGALIFGAINAPCIAVWTAFGVGMRRFLERPAVMRGFNIVMALVLIGSLYPLWVELFTVLTR